MSIVLQKTFHSTADASDQHTYSQHNSMLSRRPSSISANSSQDGDFDDDDLEEEGEATWITTHRSYSEMQGACSQLVICENDTLRVVWNIVLACLLVYTGTVFPYRLCFVELSVSGMDADDPVWTAVEWIVDGLFYFDLLAYFFFSYRDLDGMEVKNMRLIAIRYLQGFFALNLIACIPPPLVGWIIQGFSESSDAAPINKSTRLSRLQRISRLARLTRLTRLGKLFSFVMENPVWRWFQGLRGVRVINFLVGLGWAVHLVACGWYLTASLHSIEDQEATWLARRGLLEAGPFEQWFHAMYFVLTVFTTVGFGDMSANTMGEIAYVCFTMLVGAVVHSIIMSEVINIVMQVDQAALDLNSQKELVLGFARHVELEGPVMKDLFRFFEQHRGRRQAFDRERMRTLLTGCAMPRELMGSLIRGAFNGSLENNKLITTCLRYEKRMPPRFPLLVALALNSRHFVARELVYSAYDHPWNVFLVTSGTFANIAFPSKQGGVAELPPECIDPLVPKQVSCGIDNPPSRKSTGGLSGFPSERSFKATAAARTSISKGLVPTSPISLKPERALYPYQLFGAGTYFGEAELLLEPGRSRFTSARCESDPGGTVLALHAADLQKLCHDFPRFQVAWRTSSRRREERRRKCLKRLKHGHTYQTLAVMVIQRHARRLLLREDSSPPSPRPQAAGQFNSTTWQRRSFLSDEPNQVTLAHLNALRVDMLKAISNLTEDLSRALGKDLSPASSADRPSARRARRRADSDRSFGDTYPRREVSPAWQEAVSQNSLETASDSLDEAAAPSILREPPEPKYQDSLAMHERSAEEPLVWSERTAEEESQGHNNSAGHDLDQPGQASRKVSFCASNGDEAPPDEVYAERALLRVAL